MSAIAGLPTLFDEVPTLFDSRHKASGPAPVLAPPVSDTLGGESSLDDVLSGAWEGLIAHQSVACVMCGEPMTPAYGQHSRPIGGSCRACGTRLS